MSEKPLVKHAKRALNRYEANRQPGDLGDLVSLLDGRHVTTGDLGITMRQRHQLMHEYRIHQAKCLLRRLRQKTASRADWLLLQSFMSDHDISAADMETTYSEIRKIRARFCQIDS